MRKLIALLFAFSLSFSVMAQQRVVKGTVTDANGNALPGVTVSVKGKNAATQTLTDGSFSINAEAGNTLVFTYVDSDTKEVKVGNADNLQVSLQNRTRELSEVVVTAIGIKREEKALGYSISKVNPNALVQNSEPDILKGLQGKVAGVDIRSSQGTPGAATRISIRGNSSFFGTNEPLIIVDGVPFNNEQVTTSDQTSGGGAYSNGLSGLDPNDIASMNVLKGSAAAALYGSRASNGVIIITTKSGSASRSKKGMEVTYSSSMSWETIANLPVYQNEYGAGTLFNYANSNGSWGASFKSRDSIPVWPNYKTAFPSRFTDSVAYRAYPNNVKDLFRTGKVYENSISVSSGNEKAAISATGSFMKHIGYVPNSDFSRASISVGGVTRLDNGLGVRGNMSYSRTIQNGGFFGENQVTGAASSFARNLFLARNWDLSLPSEDLKGNSLTPLSGSQFDNPYWSWKHNRIITNGDRMTGGLHLDYKFSEWLQADYQIGTNINTVSRNEIIDIGSRGAEGVGQITVNDYRTQEVESNFFVTATPKIFENISVRAVVGHNVNQRTIRDDIQRGNQLIAAGIFNLKNTKTVVIDKSFMSKRRLWGAFADLTLGYKDFLFLQATGRNDWSSTLPKENRSYFYPSLSTSFVFSDAFNIKSEVFDLGKLRVSWAKVGRDADPYSLLDVYVVAPPFLGQANATGSVTARNPNLTPEFTTEKEIGTQLSFFQRRIGLDVALYSKVSTSQIAAFTLPASSGFREAIANFGKLTNKGIEVDLMLVPLRGKDFRWEMHGTFTKNKSMVEELLPGVTRFPLEGVLEGISPYLEAGKPYGYLRGSINARDSLGNLLIDPETGFMIRATDEGMVGDPNPDFKAGLSNTVTYKGFFLNVLFDMTKGGDFYSVTISSLLGRGVTADTKDRETSWIIPGVYGDPNTGKPILDNNKNLIPNISRISTNDLYFGESFAINSATEWNVYDATVYHLREVSLGYSIPADFLKKTPVGSATISLTGRNLWHLAPNVPRYTRFDPEVNSFGSSTTQGIELSAAPTTRRMGINLKVTF
jgi:TonB-linked SusC/RagA family outer membrane protein